MGARCGKRQETTQNQADMVTKWAFPLPAVIQFWPRTGAFGKYACAEGKRETGRPCPACAAPATVPMARDAPWQARYRPVRQRGCAARGHAHFRERRAGSRVTLRTIRYEIPLTPALRRCPCLMPLRWPATPRTGAAANPSPNSIRSSSPPRARPSCSGMCWPTPA